MDRPAGYLLHKYLRDPYYYESGIYKKEKKRRSVVARSSGMN